MPGLKNFLPILVVLAILGTMAEPAAALAPCDVSLSSGRSIPAALASGVGTLRDPWVVCLSSGTWNLYQNLRMPAYSELRGAGATSTTLQSFSATNILIANATGVVLRRVRVRGAQQFSNYNVLLFGATGALIEDCILENVGSINLGIHGGSDHTIVGNTLRWQGYKSSKPNPSIWGFNTQRITVRDNYVLGRNNGPGGDGEVAFHDSSDIQILDNVLEYIGASCIYFVNTSGGAIHGNTLESCGEWGLDLVQGTKNVTVYDNWIHRAHFGAVVVADACMATQQSNIQFTYNVMFNNNASGVGTCSCINVDPTSSSNVTDFGNDCGGGGQVTCNHFPSC